MLLQQNEKDMLICNEVRAVEGGKIKGCIRNRRKHLGVIFVRALRRFLPPLNQMIIVDVT